MRNAFLFCIGAISLAIASCASLQNYRYPSDYHLNDDLKSFEAPPLQQIGGDSYRLVWHAWHQKPGLILANCAKNQCILEVRHTDGYGTYEQGKLAGIFKRVISPTEFRSVAENFSTEKFYDREGDLRPGEPYMGLIKSDQEDEITFCLHAPHYYIESNVGNSYHLIYRYCQENYAEDLKVAYPLIELAEKYFPTPMQNITAQWIQEQRDQQ